MMTKAYNVICALQGKSLVTAESMTGGGIGAILTCIPGSSAVFKGGIISYSNEVKRGLLGVSKHDLEVSGAVSEPVARQMALGARRMMHADIAVSVTGLAGPAGDGFGREVGTVFIGYADATSTRVREYHFEGDREAVRDQTIEAALDLILENV
jgi:PncC family amidohydrolase